MKEIQQEREMRGSSSSLLIIRLSAFGRRDSHHPRGGWRCERVPETENRLGGGAGVCAARRDRRRRESDLCFAQAVVTGAHRRMRRNVSRL